MKKSSYVLIAVLAVFSLSFCLFGCDCGGGDNEDNGVTVLPEDSDSDDNITLAEVNQATVETALSMLLFQGVGDEPVSLACSVDIDEVFERINLVVDHVEQIINGFFSSEKKNTSMFLRAWAMKQVKDAVLSGTVINQKSEFLTGSVSSECACASGSYQATGSWDGPDAPTLFQLCNVSNIEMTMTFDSCQELGITASGDAKISLSGSLCSPDSLTVDLSNLNLKDNNNGTEIVFNTFNMVASLELLKGLEGVHAAAVMNGDMSIDGISTEYKDLSEDATFTKEGATLNTNGSITCSLFNGWLDIETVSPVTINYGDCPNGGEIKFSGIGDMAVTFNSDGSLIIGETSFNSCTDLLLW